MPSKPLPVYVINIDRTYHHFVDILGQAADVAIEVQRIQGVDGSLMPRETWVDVDHRKFVRRHGRTILPGEYGCYRSHLMALDQFVKSGSEAAIIIEDDVSFEADLPARADALRAALPRAEVIKLMNHRWPGFRPLAKTNEGDVVGRCLFGPQGSAAGYIVTRRGAEKLLKSMRVMSLPFDVALERGWDMKLAIFSTGRNLLKFDGARSTTLIGTRSDYRAAKLRPIGRLQAYLFRTSELFRRLAFVLLN